MTCAWWDNGGARPWFSCPVHGWHGRDRCPKCCTGTEPDVAVIHAPLIVSSAGCIPLEGRITFTSCQP